MPKLRVCDGDAQAATGKCGRLLQRLVLSCLNLAAGPIRPQMMSPCDKHLAAFVQEKPVQQAEEVPKAAPLLEWFLAVVNVLCIRLGPKSSPKAAADR